MSTASPVMFPPIPTPTSDPPSIIQSLLAIKQNIEITQGTRGTARSAHLHQPSALAVSLNTTTTLAKPRG